VASAFEQVTERVSVANGRVYFDGNEADDSVSRQIIRFLAEGQDVRPLARFMEKLDENPSYRSREQLYTWLRAREFSITAEGDVVMYKGVRRDLTSINSGPAVVDGEPVNGYVPNRLGSTVEFERRNVSDDPGVSCSRGLHAGTFEYADNFAQGATLTVIVNPADVVSVPSDHDTQKVRVCKYQVIGTAQQAVTTALHEWADEDEALDAEDDYYEADEFDHDTY
jgi:hypothetical protein